MDILELAAEGRTGTGKGNARKLRNSGKTPAVLYGHNSDALPLSIDTRSFRSILQTQGGAHVLKLKLDEQSPTVIVKKIQREPVNDTILHIDFQRVSMTERITASVPVALTGDSTGVRQGGILQHGLWEVEIEALPADIPDRLEGDVSELEIGGALRAGELRLPDNVTLVTAPEEAIATVLPPTAIKEEVPAEAAEEAEAAEAGETTSESTPES